MHIMLAYYACILCMHITHAYYAYCALWHMHACTAWFNYFETGPTRRFCVPTRRNRVASRAGYGPLIVEWESAPMHISAPSCDIS